MAAVCSLLLMRDSMAWMDTRTGEEVSATLSAQTMKFDFAGTLGSFYKDDRNHEEINVGQNLIKDNDGKITAVNHSTIKTEMRYQVIYDTPSGTNTIYTAAGDLVVEPASGWTIIGNYFVHDPFNVPQNPATGTSIDLIDSISYSGDNVTRARYLPGGVPFTGNVKVIVQAKQKYTNTNWTDVSWANCETWVIDSNYLP